jgi:hypothetical protein
MTREPPAFHGVWSGSPSCSIDRGPGGNATALDASRPRRHTPSKTEERVRRTRLLLIPWGNILLKPPSPEGPKSDSLSDPNEPKRKDARPFEGRASGRGSREPRSRDQMGAAACDLALSQLTGRLVRRACALPRTVNRIDRRMPKVTLIPPKGQDHRLRR